MQKYLVSYFYHATGMDFPDYIPETTIKAESRDRAIYSFRKLNGSAYSSHESFEQYMKEKQSNREWGITCNLQT